MDRVTSVVASLSLLNVCIAFLVATQTITWLCIIYRRCHYRLSPTTITLQLAAFVCLLHRLHAHDSDAHTSIVAFLILLVCVVQVRIDYITNFYTCMTHLYWLLWLILLAAVNYWFSVPVCLSICVNLPNAISCTIIFLRGRRQFKAKNQPQ